MFYWPYTVERMKFQGVGLKRGIAVFGEFKLEEPVFLQIIPELDLANAEVHGKGRFQAVVQRTGVAQESGGLYDDLEALFRTFRKHIDQEEDAKEAAADKKTFDELVEREREWDR
jgi:hypothetical protein